VLQPEQDVAWPAINTKRKKNRSERAGAVVIRGGRRGKTFNSNVPTTFSAAAVRLLSHTCVHFEGRYVWHTSIAIDFRSATPMFYSVQQFFVEQQGLRRMYILFKTSLILENLWEAGACDDQWPSRELWKANTLSALMYGYGLYQAASLRLKAKTVCR
jgi:hypothetical protein